MQQEWSNFTDNKTLTIVLSEESSKFFNGFSKIELRYNNQSVTFKSKDFFETLVEIAKKNN